jgi:hypothetical protein
MNILGRYTAITCSTTKESCGSPIWHSQIGNNETVKYLSFIGVLEPRKAKYKNTMQIERFAGKCGRANPHLTQVN